MIFVGWGVVCSCFCWVVSNINCVILLTSLRWVVGRSWFVDVWFTLCSVHVIFDVFDFGFKAFMVD